MFGGGSKIRSFWSLLSLIFLSVSSGLTIMGVVTESKSTDPNSYWALPYVIPSAIMNVLCVVLLIYLIATIKGKSNFYKLVVSFLLLSGLAAEIYMTTLLNMTHVGEQAATWIVIILNWLFRTFYVLEFVQEEWTPLFPAAKEAVKAASSSSSSSSTGTPDKLKELDKRWNELLDKLRANNGGREGLDGSSVGDAKKILSDARKSGSFNIDSVLASAKSKIKRKDGAALIGGRR